MALKFKLGDIVLVVENSDSGHEVGEVCEIVQVTESHPHYDYQILPIRNEGRYHDLSFGHPESDLVLHLTNEHVFKKDDLVVVKGNNPCGHDVGTIGKVVDCFKSNVSGVQINYYNVVPVETNSSYLYRYSILAQREYDLQKVKKKINVEGF